MPFSIFWGDLLLWHYRVILWKSLYFTYHKIYHQPKPKYPPNPHLHHLFIISYAFLSIKLEQSYGALDYDLAVDALNKDKHKLWKHMRIWQKQSF